MRYEICIVDPECKLDKGLKKQALKLMADPSCLGGEEREGAVIVGFRPSDLELTYVEQLIQRQHGFHPQLAVKEIKKI